MVEITTGSHGIYKKEHSNSSSHTDRQIASRFVFVSEFHSFNLAVYVTVTKIQHAEKENLCFLLTFPKEKFEFDMEV